MRYLIAIIYTVLLILAPLIMMPLLQWYEHTFLEPYTDIFGVYMLLALVSFGMLIMTVIRWICAIQDIDIKNF
jgi:hypothetical protein